MAKFQDNATRKGYPNYSPKNGLALFEQLSVCTCSVVMVNNNKLMGPEMSRHIYKFLPCSRFEFVLTNNKFCLSILTLYQSQLCVCTFMMIIHDI